MKKIFLLFCFIFCSILMNAQVWYFGNKAGLDFTSGIVSPVSNGQLINTGEGCTMAYDDHCNLLFYSDGITVWDRNNVVIKDGNNNFVTGAANGLYGDPSSTQSAIAVPKPGTNFDEFYIFTTDKGANIDQGAPAYKGFRYTTVKHCLSTPEVDLKNIQLSPLKSTEKISVTSIPGGGFWVLVHDFNMTPENGCNYYAYKIDPAGNLHTTTPVISNIGTQHQGAYANVQGQMKFSHDGTKVAVAIPQARIIEILDFDNSGNAPNSGKLTNPRRIKFPKDSCVDCELYGLEFSPNNRYLFIGGEYHCGCDNAKHRIYQVDLNTFLFPDLQATNCGSDIPTKTFFFVPDIQSIPLQIRVIYNGISSLDIGQFQLARDQKIYVASWTDPNTFGDLVGCIDNPDIYPATFNAAAVQLNTPQQCQAGLPTLLQDQFNCNPSAPSCDSCLTPVKYLHTGMWQGPGQNDPYWRLSPSGNAAVIVNTPLNYSSPMGGSQWISSSFPPPSVQGTYSYKIPFYIYDSLCPPPKTFELVGCVLANNATIYLKQGSNQYTLGTANSVINPTTFTFNQGFTAGNYELIIDVNNPAGSLPVIDVKAWVCCIPDSTPQIIPIPCPFEEGSSTSFPNTIINYNCSPPAVCPGNEAMYSLSLSGTYTVTAAISGSASTRIFVLSAIPTPASAMSGIVACGDIYNPAVFTYSGFSPYYIVIDDLWPGTHNFGLYVRCDEVPDCDSCHYPNLPKAYLHTGISTAWNLTSSPGVGTGTAGIVTNPGSYGIPDPLQGTHWIAGTGTSMPTTGGTYIYENTFNLVSPAGCPCAPNQVPQLKLCILADSAIVYLNGNQVGTVSSLTTSTRIVTVPGQYMSCPGSNTLKVKVINQAGSYPVADVKAWVCCADTIQEIPCPFAISGYTAYLNKILSADVMSTVALPGKEAIYSLNLTSPTRVTIKSNSNSTTEEILLLNTLPNSWPNPGQVQHQNIMAFLPQLGSAVPYSMTADIYTPGHYFIVVDDQSSSWSHFYNFQVDCEPIPECDSPCKDSVDVFYSGKTNGNNYDIHWGMWGNGQAIVVANPALYGWAPPQTGSQWISNATSPVNTPTIILFTHLFTIPDTCQSPYLSLCLMGDNTSVLLNGTWIGNTNSTLIPLNIVNSNLLKPGLPNDILIINMNPLNKFPGINIIGEVCCKQPAGINETPVEEESFKIYPNPARDQVMLESRIGIDYVSIYNSIGNKMFETRAIGELTKIDLNSLQNGLYFLIIQTKKGFYTKKMIILH